LPPSKGGRKMKWLKGEKWWREDDDLLLLVWGSLTILIGGVGFVWLIIALIIGEINLTTA